MFNRLRKSLQFSLIVGFSLSLSSAKGRSFVEVLSCPLEGDGKSNFSISFAQNVSFGRRQQPTGKTDGGMPSRIERCRAQDLSHSYLLAYIIQYRN